MNYRTILLATAAVMFAGAANAEDITAPMYLPGAGKVLSNTSLQYERTSLKHNAGAGEDFRASEEITYGVTDNFSVVAEIGNQFDFEGLTNQEYNNDHNFDYAIGAKYNMQHGNWLAQVGASYYTFDPKSWYGHRGNDERWYRKTVLQDKYPEMTVNFFQMFVSSLLGGILGILFLIPFRKYFVSDKHGEYPFPEATASTQVLVSGEKGGSQAKPLLFAGLIGGLYDFIVATFGWWNENFTTRVCGWGEMVAEKAKLVMKINTGAAVLGLGYIVGLKYAAIICAGSLVVWLVIVPGMALLFGDQVLNAWNPALTQTISEMSPELIFKEYAKSIGIGGIAMAGVIGIVRSWGIIKSAVGLAAKEMGGKKVEANVIRTQKDLSMKIIAFGSIFTILLILLFFFFDVMHGNVLHSIVAILLVAGIAFLFTTVAANAIAIVGTNPVSGMTLMTLILASVVMVAVGLKGATGMVAALVMGGVVCTALSMAGGFITDLKIGYWLGSTPAKQETWKFLGTLVSAATVGGVIMILNKTYGFSTGALAAPQANAMAAVIDPLMNGVGAPWLLYGIGAVLALVLTYFKVPALAFALGMFIPLELNLPLLVGGAVNWYVTTRSKDEAVNAERGEKGTLLASGFIAGGALMGVVSAAMRFGGINLINEEWLSNPLSEVLSMAAYILLIIWLVKASMHIKKK